MIVYVATPCKPMTGRLVHQLHQQLKRTPAKGVQAKAQDQTNVCSSDTSQVLQSRPAKDSSGTVGRYYVRSLPSIMSEMQRDMDSLARGLFGDEVQSRYETTLHGINADIQEYEHSYTVMADVPGVGKDSIKVTVDLEGVLSITGERKHTASEESEGLKRVERFCGKFQRSFQLPKDAMLDEVSASLENGVLTISIGKISKDKTGVRTIPVADSDKLPMQS